MITDISLPTYIITKSHAMQLLTNVCSFYIDYYETILIDMLIIV